MARLREGRANTARGAAHFLRGDVGPGALRRGQGSTHGAGRQRLLHPRRGPGLPQDESPLLHHRPPAPEPAGPDRGHTRGGLETHPLLDGGRRRRGRNHLHPLRQSARRRAGAAHRPAGSAHPRLPVGAIRHLQLSRLHHRPSGGYPGTIPWNWRPTTAATPRSRTPSGTSSTAWGSIISPRGASRPTEPGWRYRSWPTTWPAGPGASLWERRWRPPRPSGGASFPWPDASPARPGASYCICPGAGLGKPSSSPPWRGCGPCHSPPDAAGCNQLAHQPN